MAEQTAKQNATKKFELELVTNRAADIRDVLDLAAAAFDTPYTVATTGERQASAIIEQIIPYIRNARKYADNPLDLEALARGRQPN
jgi:hypothetical protein